MVQRLLTLIALCLAQVFVAPTLADEPIIKGYLLFETWEGIGGSLVTDLTTNAAFPNELSLGTSSPNAYPFPLHHARHAVFFTRLLLPRSYSYHSEVPPPDRMYASILSPYFFSEYAIKSSIHSVVILIH